MIQHQTRFTKENVDDKSRKKREKYKNKKFIKSSHRNNRCLNLYKYRNYWINPRKRMANLDEISELSLFLTNNDCADYINGTVIRIDGGEYNQNSGQFNFITNIPFWEKIF